MQSRIGLWGGSCAVRLPKMAVETLGLHEGETVSLELKAGALILRPAKPRYALDDLVQQARQSSAPAALDEAPVGDESL